MKVCPHCHKELPDDSTFCTYCGKMIEKVSMKDLEKAKENISKEMTKKDSHLKQNPRENSWGKLALMIFLVSLIGLDFIVATVINALGMDSKFIFIISFICYIFAIGCAIMSFVIDYQDKKKGYQPNGNGKFSMVAMAMGIYIALLNLTTVILK